VAFIYKDYPLTEIHPWAMHAAVDANCLAARNSDAYWDFADYIHANPQAINSQRGHDEQFAALDRTALARGANFHVDAVKLQACMKDPKAEDAVKASVKQGESLDVNGTPTMFINGEMLHGARPVSEVRAAIDSALKRVGVTPPAQPTAAQSSTLPANGGAPAKQ
jgi:protein-disulfide isomerase